MKSKEIKELFFVLLAMALLSAFALLAGCSKPPLPTVTEKQQENSNTTVIQYGTTEIDRSKAITDSLKIIIGDIRTGMASCDSLCQDEMTRLLGQLNHEKVSGDNKYGILYDKYKKQLIMYSKLAETVNTSSIVTKDSIVYVNKNYTKEIPVTTNIIPWYYKYSAYIGWAFLFILAGYLIFKIRSWTQNTKLPL